MNDEEIINNAPEKLIKYFVNGITHNLILWIISKEAIHGYGIMKELEKFFNFDNMECEVNINSSKVYPILSAMEKSGLITGEWKVNDNNKRVKFYSITDEGLIVLDNIKKHLNSTLTNPSWIEYMEDMTGKEFNNEKCN